MLWSLVHRFLVLGTCFKYSGSSSLFGFRLVRVYKTSYLMDFLLSTLSVSQSCNFLALNLSARSLVISPGQPIVSHLIVCVIDLQLLSTKLVETTWTINNINFLSVSFGLFPLNRETTL